MVLVLNAGSSSLKYALFEQNNIVESGIYEEVKSHHKILHAIVKKLQHKNITSVAHRVVHGGNYFDKPIILTKESIQKLRTLTHLAPLHNPANIEPMEYFLHHHPKLPQVAVFDTAFHTTLPNKAAEYAIPKKLSQQYNIRKYGFHGISYSYITKEMAKILNKPTQKLNLIIAHLGNGSSVCAVVKGKSVDTSMGFTPLEGLVMGTRGGDIDAGILLFLQEYGKISTKELGNILYKECGLKALCGTSDMREILKTDTPQAKEALQSYIYRVQKYIASYLAVVQNLDGVVFCGGIGEHSTIIRKKIITNLAHLGFILNEKRNSANETLISDAASNIKLFVVPTNEELEIAKCANELLNLQQPDKNRAFL